MNNSFDFFDKVYCIHLPKEKERKTLIESEFQKVGINNVSYVHADPPPTDFTMSNMSRSPRGEFGCNLSQIKAVVHAISAQNEVSLFLEDDIVFNSQANEHLECALKQLPSDWDILYLGGHPRGPAKRVNTSLVKVSRFSFADSYAIKKETLLRLFDEWTNRISKPKAPYDCILGNFTQKVNTYCVYPIICEQRPGRSEISGQYEDKKGLITSRWKKWMT